MNLHINGNIPRDMLHPLSWAPKHKVLRGMPAVNVEMLNRRYRAEFGEDLTVNHSYRSRLRQVGVKFLHRDRAAPVGQSMHGFGLALDLGGVRFGTAQYDWLMENAPDYDWRNPRWAQVDGTNPEAWHWEFL